jgi:hypothetical protein
MYKSIIFVDFENIQKIDTSLINSKVKIIVMVGLNQDNNAFEFAKNLFVNISSMELIKVNGQGPNALDMFIAFYIGKYFDSIKESEIIIYSNDTDYDQLIKHLKMNGLSIERKGFNKNTNKRAIEKNTTNSEVKIVKPENNDTRRIIEYLKKQTQSQKSKWPKKIKTLENYLNTHFSQDIPLDNIKISINYMIKNNYITINGNKIIYNNL